MASAPQLDTPEKAVAPSEADFILTRADDAQPIPPGKWALLTMTVLARYPLLHSVFWLSVVGMAASSDAADASEALKVAIECWLLYSFGKYIITGTCALRGLAKLRRNDAKSADSWAQGASTADELLSYDDVVHVICIPNYKEDPETLRRTVATLADQRDAKTALVIVLAMEARDPLARATAQTLRSEFRDRFRAMHCTLHALQRGEVAGKSSNENWAVRCAKRRLCDELGVRSDRIVVTTCDADTYFHENHFAALSAAYCSAAPKRRRRTFWQACTQFYPNCDHVPMLCSVRYALLSVGFLGQMSNPLHYRLPFSCYSLALDLAVEAHYWDPAVIPEDWHMFLRCFYATRGGVKVDPIFLPVGCECVVDVSAYKTIGACYDQAKRWQWGAIDVGYIAARTRDAPPQRQLAVALAAQEHHLLYPLMWIVLAAAPWLVEGWAMGWRLKLWVGFFVANFVLLNVLDHAYRELLSRDRGCGGPDAASLKTPRLSRVLAFAAFPLADLLLFVLPSLHAHARMALSTRFDYVVAPKVACCMQRGPSSQVLLASLPDAPLRKYNAVTSGAGVETTQDPTNGSECQLTVPCGVKERDTPAS